jgi:hypothetical protein
LATILTITNFSIIKIESIVTEPSEPAKNIGSNTYSRTVKESHMPQKLTTTINKISQVPNSVNLLIIQDQGNTKEKNRVAFIKMLSEVSEFMSLFVRYIT